MKEKIKAGIIGGAGYTGGEMIRLLMNHPDVTLTFVHSRSNAGNPLYKVHTDLLGDTEMLFTDHLDMETDVLFLCLGHGESKKFLQEHKINPATGIIDLSQDFRLGDSIDGRTFIYGLPELKKAEIKTAQNIANPGCFATTIQLGLLPLVGKRLLNEVHTTGITGSTGAGQKLQATTQHSWRNNNVNAYKTHTHQHLREISKVLDIADKITFVPWRGDFTRGIFVTSYLKSDLSLEAANKLYKEYYATHPFTHVSDVMINVKQIVNTNKAFLFLEKEGPNLIIHSALDNLLKGASGQAVQNMNLMFGLEETSGLKLKSVVF